METTPATLTREQRHTLERIAANAQIVGVIRGENVTRGQLAEAFRVVENPTNWKLPIDAVVDHATVCRVGGPAFIREAVKFFAGCTPTIENETNTHMRIRAVGYYAAVGA